MKTDAELRHFDWSYPAGFGHEIVHVIVLPERLPVSRMRLCKVHLAFCAAFSRIDTSVELSSRTRFMGT